MVPIKSTPAPPQLEVISGLLFLGAKLVDALMQLVETVSTLVRSSFHFLLGTGSEWQEARLITPMKFNLKQPRDFRLALGGVNGQSVRVN